MRVVSTTILARHSGGRLKRQHHSFPVADTAKSWAMTRKGNSVMETPTLRPKRDRRTQPRIPPSDIAHRAYELYMQRDGEHGHDVDDWLQAERELRKATRVPSRQGDVLPTRTIPEDADIVVHEEDREGTLAYVLHTASGADQYLLRTCDEAVGQAVTFAKRQHVRAWLTDDGYDFVLLEDFRVMESV
jgi:Protein of unknown function (DUF2934)